MTQELIYTSAPRGLKPGSRGFCTVASTQGIPAPLVERLESLSGYRPIYPAGSSTALENPVSYAHWRISVGGKLSSVLSRVCFAGFDYTQRSNKLAHHLVLDPSEQTPAGPAWVMMQPGLMETGWSGEPHLMPAGRRIPGGDNPLHVCETWATMAGDAGWAGALVDAFILDASKPAYIICEPGMDLLPLINEAIALLPPHLRWQVTFNTYFTELPAGLACTWRCCVAGTPAAKEAGRLATSGIVVDLRQTTAASFNSAYITAARTGTFPADLPAAPTEVMDEAMQMSSGFEADRPHDSTRSRVPRKRQNVEDFALVDSPIAASRSTIPGGRSHDAEVVVVERVRTSPVFWAVAILWPIVVAGIVWLLVLQSGRNPLSSADDQTASVTLQSHDAQDTDDDSAPEPVTINAEATEGASEASESQGNAAKVADATPTVREDDPLPPSDDQPVVPASTDETPAKEPEIAGTDDAPDNIAAADQAPDEQTPAIGQQIVEPQAPAVRVQPSPIPVVLDLPDESTNEPIDLKVNLGPITKLEIAAPPQLETLEIEMEDNGLIAFLVKGGIHSGTERARLRISDNPGVVLQATTGSLHKDVIDLLRYSLLTATDQHDQEHRFQFCKPELLVAPMATSVDMRFPKNDAANQRFLRLEAETGTSWSVEHKAQHEVVLKHNDDAALQVSASYNRGQIACDWMNQRRKIEGQHTKITKRLETLREQLNFAQGEIAKQEKLVQETLAKDRKGPQANLDAMQTAYQLREQEQSELATEIQSFNGQLQHLDNLLDDLQLIIKLENGVQLARLKYRKGDE